MEQHVKAVGFMHALFACIGLAFVVFVCVAFGAIVNALSASSAVSSILGAHGMQFLTTILVGFSGLVLVCSLPEIVAGFALMHYQGWARWVIVVISLLHLTAFPVGTMVGGYSLWVLLNPEVGALFDRRNG